MVSSGAVHVFFPKRILFHFISRTGPSGSSFVFMFPFYFQDVDVVVPTVAPLVFAPSATKV